MNARQIAQNDRDERGNFFTVSSTRMSVQMGFQIVRSLLLDYNSN